MKKITLVLSFLGITASVFAQSQLRTLSHGGVERQYKLYVPAAYGPGDKVPLVFVLHGLGDNMNNMEQVGMTLIADTANFIVITPQAVADPLVTTFLGVEGTAWNSGAGASVPGFTYYPNQNINDVGFIDTLIAVTASEYDIDHRRVYVCGFSMGGFMSNRLACELNNKIAAVAPVAATIGDGITCTPGRAVPHISFHGTADATVGYDTAGFGTSVPEMLNFWANNNGCTTPDTLPVPDVANDGLTVEHIVYNNCSADAELEHFKVFGADHTWLGPNNDIFYTAEIWKFFRRFVHPDQTLAVNSPTPLSESRVSPNPAASGAELSLMQADASVQALIMSLTGVIISKSWVNDSKLRLPELSQGVYLVAYTAKNGKPVQQKLVVR